MPRFARRYPRRRHPATSCCMFCVFSQWIALNAQSCTLSKMHEGLQSSMPTGGASHANAPWRAVAVGNSVISTEGISVVFDSAFPRLAIVSCCPLFWLFFGEYSLLVCVFVSGGTPCLFCNEEHCVRRGLQACKMPKTAESRTILCV